MFDLFVIQSILRVLPSTCEAQGFKIGLELAFNFSFRSCYKIDSKIKY